MTNRVRQEQDKIEEIMEGKQLPINTRYNPQLALGFYMCFPDGSENKDQFFNAFPECATPDGLRLLGTNSKKFDPETYAMMGMAFQIQEVTGRLEWDSNMLYDFSFLAGPFSSRDEVREHSELILDTRWRKTE
jgi:hypothetical protein